MKHPFEKLFDSALADSTSDDNRLAAVVAELKDQGYPEAEIHQALKHFARGLIGDTESEIADSTLRGISDWVHE
jgi:hypothetical protein